MKGFTACLLVAGALLSATARRPAGDAAKSAEIFAEEFGDRHSVTAGKNKKGPSLIAVVGRDAGIVACLSGYCGDMKQAGFVWTVERLDAFIAQPRKALPEGRMKQGGLPNSRARADLISYLSRLK
jgi:cytochrome c